MDLSMVLMAAWATDASMASVGNGDMRLQTSIWPPVLDIQWPQMAAQTMNLHIASCSTTYHKHQHGPWWHFTLQTLIWPKRAAQTMEFLRRSNPENKPFSNSDILSLLRARAITVPGTVLGGRACMG